MSVTFVDIRSLLGRRLYCTCTVVVVCVVFSDFVFDNCYVLVSITSLPYYILHVGSSCECVCVFSYFVFDNCCFYDKLTMLHVHVYCL